jgi:alcohol dehydrogenase
MMAQNRSVLGFNLIWLWNQIDRLAAVYEALDRIMRVPPMVGRRFAFDDALTALRFLQSGESIGKVVLEL